MRSLTEFQPRCQYFQGSSKPCNSGFEPIQPLKLATGESYRLPKLVRSGRLKSQGVKASVERLGIFVDRDVWLRPDKNPNQSSCVCNLLRKLCNDDMSHRSRRVVLHKWSRHSSLFLKSLGLEALKKEASIVAQYTWLNQRDIRNFSEKICITEL